MKTSVALCTYNGQQFLKQQLDSILNQTHKVDEIVVCDDGSTDKTIEILENYSANYPNTFYIYQNEINLRSVKNFEKAVKLCSGDIIFLSDQDDVWVDNKVEKYVDYFDKNPNIEVLASNGYCIDENSKVHDKYSIWDVPQFLRDAKIKFDYYQIIALQFNISTGSTMAFKKEIVSKTVPFPVIKDFHHDEWIALISSKNKNFELLNEKYYYYRIHSNQQVGGVFFDKSAETKQRFLNLFDDKFTNYTFSANKRLIKGLIYSYKKNELLAQCGGDYSTYFEENAKILKKEIIKMTQQLKDKFFLKYVLLRITDKLLNKRQKPF